MKKKIISVFKCLSLICFVLGILFALAEHFIADAEHYPSIGKLLNPEYFNAKAALEKIDANETLTKDDLGSAEIERILKDHLVQVPENQGKAETIKRCSFERMSHSMGSTITSSSGTTVLLGVRMRVDGKEVVINDLDYNVVSKGVAALRQKMTVPAMEWLFFLGLSLVIISKITDVVLGKADKEQSNH